MSEQADLYRGALRLSAEFFLSTVDRIAADQWDTPALGVWSVRELAAHTTKALALIERATAEPPTMTDAVDYVRQSSASSGAASLIAERGKAEAIELGPEPGTAIHRVVDQAITYLDNTSDDQSIRVRMGAIRLDYRAGLSSLSCIPSIWGRRSGRTWSHQRMRWRPCCTSSLTSRSSSGTPPTWRSSRRGVL